MLAAVVVLLAVCASGLAFHALAHSSNAAVRTRGPWLAAAAFAIASVALFAPFYRHDPSRIVSSYILPQLLLSALIFGEAALLSRWLITMWPQRGRFLSAHTLLLTLFGGLTVIVVVSVYPGS